MERVEMELEQEESGLVAPLVAQVLMEESDEMAVGWEV